MPVSAQIWSDLWNTLSLKLRQDCETVKTLFDNTDIMHIFKIFKYTDHLVWRKLLAVHDTIFNVGLATRRWDGTIIKNLVERIQLLISGLTREPFSTIDADLASPFNSQFYFHKNNISNNFHFFCLSKDPSQVCMTQYWIKNIYLIIFLFFHIFSV